MGRFLRRALFVGVAIALAAVAVAVGLERFGSRASPPPVPDRAQSEVALVVLSKAKRVLQLVDAQGNELARYEVAMGSNPIGHKQREGDGRTPEGRYVLDWRNPESAFHLSLHVSYPNEADIQAARARGDDPGGMIMIHGARNGLGWIGAAHRLMDWTDGCIAVTNDEVREIWSLVPNGTPIEIRP